MNEIKPEHLEAAWKNQRLVHGALKAAHVHCYSQNYEDYLQEGLILYAEMLANNEDKPQEEVDKLAFRKIVWRTTDQLRKVQRDTERQDSDDQLLFQGYAENSDRLIGIKELLAQLDKVDQQILLEEIIANRPQKQVAAEAGITVRTLTRRKKKLLNQLREKLF